MPLRKISPNDIGIMLSSIQDKDGFIKARVAIYEEYTDHIVITFQVYDQSGIMVDVCPKYYIGRSR